MLDEDRRARRRQAATWIVTGHVAALYESELYDMLPQTRGGYQRLQEFGIRFGYERVVLYLEPEPGGRVETNTARTLLLLDHEPLPWARWEAEFRAAMPAEIRRLQERLAGSDDSSRREAIRERLPAHLPLYRISRYRAARLPGGRDAIPGASLPADVDEPAAPAPGPAAPPPWPAAREAEQGPAADEGEDAGGVEEPVVELPEVMWVSVRDRTRAPGTSRTRLPAVTRIATSSRSTRTFACSPTWRAAGSGNIKAFPAPAERSTRSYGNGSSRRWWKSCSQPGASAAPRTGTVTSSPACSPRPRSPPRCCRRRADQEAPRPEARVLSRVARGYVAATARAVL